MNLKHSCFYVAVIKKKLMKYSKSKLDGIQQIGLNLADTVYFL